VTTPAPVSGDCRINHFGIQVADLSRSLHFYRDLVGLDVAKQVVLDDDLARTLVGYPTATMHVAHLKLPNSSAYLEILEYQGVERAPIDTSTARPGTCHLCFQVEDLDAVYARLSAAGVASVSTVLTATDPSYVGVKVVYMIDPDGIRVELLDSGPLKTETELGTTK
jgi:lactoylglutathione lyase